MRRIARPVLGPDIGVIAREHRPGLDRCRDGGGRIGLGLGARGVGAFVGSEIGDEADARCGATGPGLVPEGGHGIGRVDPGLGDDVADPGCLGLGARGGVGSVGRIGHEAVGRAGPDRPDVGDVEVGTGLEVGSDAAVGRRGIGAGGVVAGRSREGRHGVALALGRGALGRGGLVVRIVKRGLLRGVVGPGIGRERGQCPSLGRERYRRGHARGRRGVRPGLGGTGPRLDPDELAGRDLDPGRGGRLDDRPAFLRALPLAGAAGPGRRRRVGPGERVARGVESLLVRARTGRVGRDREGRGPRSRRPGPGRVGRADAPAGGLGQEEGHQGEVRQDEPPRHGGDRHAGAEHQPPHEHRHGPRHA